MLNVIILAGNAVSDPTVRNTQTGKTIATVRLAVNNPLNDEEVLYIDVDTWDKQSDFVQKYVKKGNSLSVVGRLKSRDFTGQDGVKRKAYSVVCSQINFIGSKKKDNAPADDESSGYDISPLDAEFTSTDNSNIAAKAAAALAKMKASNVPKSGDEF